MTDDPFRIAPKSEKKKIKTYKAKTFKKYKVRPYSAPPEKKEEDLENPIKKKRRNRYRNISDLAKKEAKKRKKLKLKNKIHKDIDDRLKSGFYSGLGEVETALKVGNKLKLTDAQENLQRLGSELNEEITNLSDRWDTYHSSGMRNDPDE